MIRYLYCCYLKCCQEVIGRETAMRWFCVYHQSKPKAMKERKKAARECNTFCNHQLIFLFSDGLRPKICTRVVGCKFPFLCTSLSSSKGNVYILILWFRLSRVYTRNVVRLVAWLGFWGTQDFKHFSPACATISVVSVSYARIHVLPNANKILFSWHEGILPAMVQIIREPSF